MWHLEVQFTGGPGSIGLVVVFGALRDLFQSK